MKEHPLLFSGPMVQSLLNGSKTQTRRVKGLQKINENPDDWIIYPNVFKRAGGDIYAAGFQNKKTRDELIIKIPYGWRGDLLWVKETSFYCHDDHNLEGMKTRYFYKASLHESNFEWFKEQGYKWKPSIFMPKAAARIWLEITGIRIERVQDISEEDSIAEGCIMDIDGMPKEILHSSGVGYIGWDCAKEWYVDLWQSLNGEESWDANPYCWVIEFKKIEHD